MMHQLNLLKEKDGFDCKKLSHSSSLLEFYHAITQGCHILITQPHLKGDAIRLSFAMLEQISQIRVSHDISKQYDSIIMEIVKLHKYLDHRKIFFLENIESIIFASSNRSYLKRSLEAIAKAKNEQSRVLWKR